jgi:cell division control protein CDC15
MALMKRRQSLAKLPNPDQDIALGKVIGEGAYGKVYKAVLKKTSEIVAVKVVELDEEELEEILLELKVLARFSMHKNIARFYGAYVKSEEDDGDDDDSVQVDLK